MIIVPRGYDGFNDIFELNKERINVVKSNMKDEAGINFTVECINWLLKKNDFTTAKELLSILFHEEISSCVYKDFLNKLVGVNIDTFTEKLGESFKLQGVKGFTFNAMLILHKMDAK